MTPLKARIFELLRRAGADGIAGDDLYRIVYDGQLPSYKGYGERRSRACLKSHIWQINRQLRGWRIRGSSCAGGWYWLQRQSEWDAMWARPFGLTASEQSEIKSDG